MIEVTINSPTVFIVPSQALRVLIVKSIIPKLASLTPFLLISNSATQVEKVSLIFFPTPDKTLEIPSTLG